MAGTPYTIGELHALQFNADKCQAAIALLRVEVVERDIDVILLQEPYIVCGKVGGLSYRWSVFAEAGEGCRSAVIVTRPEIGAFPLHVSRYVVAVEIRTPTTSWVAVSAYFPPSFNDGFLGSLGEVVGSLPRVLVGGDFNAKHSSWGSPIDDGPGQSVKEAVDSWDMHILNDPGSIATFSASYGESWIDLTFVSGAMLRFMKDWRVVDAESGSGHRMIVYNLSLDTPRQETRRYRLTARNHHFFSNALREELPALLPRLREVETAVDLEDLVRGLTATVTGVADRTLVSRKPGTHRSVPWWTQELGVQRKRVRALRRRFQRCNDAELRPTRKLEFQRANAEYKRAVNSAKAASWQRFCERVSDECPFSFPYKLVADKVRVASAPGLLKRPDGSLSESVDGSMDILLRSLFPSDEQDDESPEQRELRRHAELPACSLPALPLGASEVTRVISNLKKGKAPGRDGITAEMVQVLHRVEPELLRAVY